VQFGNHQRIKRERPVVLGELVAEDETDGNDQGRFAPAFRRQALDGVKTGLDDCSSRRQEALTFSARQI